MPPASASLTPALRGEWMQLWQLAPLPTSHRDEGRGPISCRFLPYYDLNLPGAWQLLVSEWGGGKDYAVINDAPAP